MATIKDVAKKAGVSTGTVDRILHKRGRFSEETAERVYAAVKELGYAPNILARNLSTSRTCRLAVFMPLPEQDSHYWSLPRDGMDKALSELSPYGVSLEYFFFDRYDRLSCLDAVERATAFSCDGIISAPLREEETETLLKMKQVPALFFDSDLEYERRLAFVGQNSRSGGELAAKLMNLLAAGREGKYLIMTPQTDYYHLSERMAGFRERADRETTFLPTGIEARHDRKEFCAAMDTAFSAGLGGIFVTDASAHYAAEYLAERERDVPLIGFDLVEENRKAVESGRIDFLLTQQPVEQGYRAVRLMYRCLMLGETDPGDQIMATQIITKENLPD